MAEIYTKWTFEKDTALIEFKMNSTTVTTYTLQDNLVSIPSIDSVIETDVGSGFNSLKSLLAWIAFASNNLPLTLSPRSPFKLELEVSLDKTEMKFKIEDYLLTNASYNHELELITWNPHLAAILEWTDFKHWIGRLEGFYELIR